MLSAPALPGRSPLQRIYGFIMHAALARTSRTLHWVSSALGLASLFFFSITGITLNHPGWFSSQRSSDYAEVQLTSGWRTEFAAADDNGRLGLLAEQVRRHWQISLPRNIDRDDVEWVLDYQRPGGVATVVLDVELGVLSLEIVNDGFIALLNDLHKGRHSGAVWVFLIDVTAVICLLFALTGLLLLLVHAGKRPSTWPLVAVGAVLPLVLYWIFVP
ncbi:MAG: PepSY-associated TM helix domain-containing protein [Halioglobus sp.]